MFEHNNIWYGNFLGRDTDFWKSHQFVFDKIIKNYVNFSNIIEFNLY